jgi:hypothetical protein
MKNNLYSSDQALYQKMVMLWKSWQADNKILPSSQDEKLESGFTKNITPREHIDVTLQKQVLGHDLWRVRIENCGQSKSHFSITSPEESTDAPGGYIVMVCDGCVNIQADNGVEELVNALGTVAN